MTHPIQWNGSSTSFGPEYARAQNSRRLAGADEIAGAERVCRDLHKLGFSVEGGLFTASEVGAPHQRERVFILGLADAYGKRLERIWADTGKIGRPDAGRSAGLRDRAIVVDAESIRWGEGRTEPELRSGRPTTPSTDGAMDDATDGSGAGYGGVSGIEHMADAYRYEPSAFRRNAREVQDTSEGEGRTEYCSALSGRLGLPDFPPGPGDADGWREVLVRAPELEPAFRRVADGLASRIDIARVDRLRMLGNGVVPLEAGYALRTLITRLAARGSAGAARLIRMMEGTEG